MLSSIWKNEKLFKFLALFIVCALLFFSCDRRSNFSENRKIEISATERQWMEKFFHDVMLEHGAIFTLWGSKPVTRFILDEYSDEEVATYLDSLSEDELLNARIVNDYNLPENWALWKKEASRFPSKRYLFCEDPSNKEDGVTLVYFIDIISTTLTIKNNYQSFKQVVGYDFDPALVIAEIKNPEFPFWKTVWNSSLLNGLLFGYGRENAYAYSSRQEMGDDSFLASLIELSSKNQQIPSQITLKNFSIPRFFSFVENDPIKARYEEEKIQIQRKYKNHDFITLTLERFSKD